MTATPAQVAALMALAAFLGLIALRKGFASVSL